MEKTSGTVVKLTGQHEALARQLINTGALTAIENALVGRIMATWLETDPDEHEEREGYWLHARAVLQVTRETIPELTMDDETLADDAKRSFDGSGYHWAMQWIERMRGRR